MIALPDNPTGADLVTAIRMCARERDVSANVLLLELTNDPKKWETQTAIARKPKPHTIERVHALLAGDPVPPAPVNNFQARASGAKGATATSLTLSEERLYDWLGRCARHVLACPENSEIANVMGYASAAGGGRLLEALERKGRIEIARGHNCRVVTIMATGQRTRGVVLTPRPRSAAAATDAATRSYRSTGEKRPAIALDDLAARIERDQAARRAEREHWLDVEQQRYGLTRRGRLPEDMPA